MIIEDAKYVTPEHDILDAIDLMLDKNLYELPVVDKSGRLLGEVNYFQIIVNWARHRKKPHFQTIEMKYK